MRLGLIGLGRIGAFHANTLVGIPAIDSLVVTDIDRSKVDDVVDRVGVEGVDTLKDLFSAGVDGVVIAASTDAHTSWSPSGSRRRGAASAPGRVRRARADRLPAPIRSAIAAARAAVESGELGWINTIRSTTLDPEPPTPEYVAVSGGIFRDCGVHDFDIIRWVTGQEAVEVYATGTNRGADFFRRTATSTRPPCHRHLRGRCIRCRVKHSLQRPRV